MKRKLFLFLLVGLAFSVAGLQPAQALQFDLNYEYSDATAPQGTPPWLTATFEDVVDSDTVELTMSSLGLIDDEFVTKWAFNFYHPVIEVTYFDFVYVSGPAAIVGQAEDFYKAGPAHGFDILFEFSEAEAYRFGKDMTAVFSITYAGISANSFDSDNAGKEPFIYRTAAHVQGIGLDGEGSGWIAPAAVSEAPTLFLVGIGLIGLAGFGRRRFKA